MNIAAKRSKILEHIALERHIASVSREASRRKGSVTAVYSMNDPLPIPSSICNTPILVPVPLNQQDTNVPKLSPENIELMKMQQFHQQQLQQKHQMYLAQQPSGYFVQSFVPFTQQPMIRPNFYLGQPIHKPEFANPFGRDVPGMREVRSAPPPPLMSLNSLWSF